jgi:hypothetical protein
VRGLGRGLVLVEEQSEATEPERVAALAGALAEVSC